MRDLKRLSLTSQGSDVGKERYARCSCFDMLVVYQPYFWARERLDFIFTKWFLAGLWEQIVAVVPLSLYIFAFQYWVLDGTIENVGGVVGGLLLCIIGLWIFLEGLHHGLMELAYAVGRWLRARSSWAFNLFVALIIGTGVTMAEPAIVALQTIASALSVEDTPYLYYIISNKPTVLSFTIGLGVGFAVVLGFCKMRYNWRLRPMILATLLPTSVIATAMAMHPDLKTMIGFAWDCGAITTGEVTVPIIVALGSGIAATEAVDNPYSGLGIVTLGSIIPVLFVEILCVSIWLIVPKDSIVVVEIIEEKAWWEHSGIHELVETLEITIPMIAFLFCILIFVLKEKLPMVNLTKFFDHDNDYAYRMQVKNGQETSPLNRINYLWGGLLATIVGLYVFNVGLTQGLSKLGYGVGATVPKLFVENETWGEALYTDSIGIEIMLAFAFLLGYGATVAEPALDIMGSEVESLSKKKFTKRMLIHSISFGVGLGALLGLARIVFHHPVIWYIIPLYWVAMILTYFSSEAILHIAWDASAVTTGPVTVPLILGVGIATALEVKATEGFGILALASLCPILSTLVLGLIIQIPWIEGYVYKGTVTDEAAESELEHMLSDESGEMPNYGAINPTPLDSEDSGQSELYEQKDELVPLDEESSESIRWRGSSNGVYVV
eukprot:TRINITY_DN8923_c0_g1_i1.p1 TRINITY_DN8923_c0_g1~~TRINITY_DN8923_c0_g1_i1.p1  ORF type:complete len:666 (+),score=85.12 TRINITY_DN8923_c0_g1_i1:48-2045(+)